jgi:arylsulfatase A
MRIFKGPVLRLSCWSLGLVLAAGGSVAQAADRAPNVVLIVADDLGWADVGFNGRKEWSTPHLDALASRGVVLKRCYAGSPVCGPSRACLLTGKYTIHSGVRRNDQDLPTEEVTIAEALRSQGYSTALFGKWQHGKPRGGREDYGHPLDQGFDEFFGYTNSYEAIEKFPAELWQGRERVPVSGYIDDLITDRAIDFLNRCKNGPFFLDLSYLAPHFTISAPPDEVEKLQGRVLETDPTRPLNAHYAAMVTRLDHNIGRLIQTLDRLGLTKDTLIVFTSDNGATFEWANQGTSAALDSNAPLRGQKRTLWEGGIRVPGLVCWPGKIAGGQVSHEVIHHADLLPTFVAAARGTVDPAWRVDGANLLRHWTGQERAPVRILFWEWRSEGTDQVAAMLGSDKLIVTAGGKPELYDVASDVSERRDLFATHLERGKRLQEELKAWLASADKRGEE